MKKLSILIVAVALIWSCYVGYTSAYFTDNVTSAQNVITSGNIQIVQHEQERVKDSNGEYTARLRNYTQNQALMPLVQPGNANYYTANFGEHTVELRDSSAGNYVDKIVTVKNVGSNPAYLRTFIAVPDAGYQSSSPDDNWLCCEFNEGGSSLWSWKKGSSDDWDMVNDAVIDGVKYDIYIGTYKDVLAPEKTTAPSLLGFYLNDSVESLEEIDGSFEILVTTQAVQTTAFDDPHNALDTVFGAVTDTCNPWVNDNAIISVSTQSALDDAVANNNLRGKTIRLGKGTYTLPEALPAAASFMGHGADTVIDNDGMLKGNAVEFFNVTFKNDVAYNGNGEFDAVTFKGEFTATFNNPSYITDCTFEEGCSWNTTDAAIKDKILFENCTGSITTS